MINQKEVKLLSELLRKAGIKADLSSIQTRIKLKQDVIKSIEDRLGRGEKCVVFLSKGEDAVCWSLDGYLNRKKQLLSVRINPNPGVKV